MYSRKILASLGFALALVVMGSSGCGQKIEVGVRQHAAERLDVSEDDLRVTERSALSTEEHRVFRVSHRHRKLELIVVTTPRGKVITDDRAADAFAVLASAEKLAERFERLGGSRIAGWYGALGGGEVCGELVDDGEENLVSTENLADGARRLSYRFTDEEGAKRCQLVIAPDGKVRDVAAIVAPLAKRS